MKITANVQSHIMHSLFEIDVRLFIRNIVFLICFYDFDEKYTVYIDVSVARYCRRRVD